MAKQIDRCEGGQDADEGGKRHQLQIMGVNDAIIDLQHVTIPGGGNTALTRISGKTVRTGKTTHSADAGMNLRADLLLDWLTKNNARWRARAPMQKQTARKIAFALSATRSRSRLR